MKIAATLGVALLPLMISGCLFSKDKLAEVTAVATNSERYLYVSSGTCFHTAAANVGSRYITRYNLNQTNPSPEVLYDFTVDGENAYPAGMVDLGDSFLVALNTNAGGVAASDTKKIVKINKSTNNETLFLNNATTLPTATRLHGMVRSSSDGGVVIARSAGTAGFLEKVDFTSKSRYIGGCTSAVAPFISNCTTPAYGVSSNVAGSPTTLAAASLNITSMVNSKDGTRLLAVNSVAASPFLFSLHQNGVGVNATTTNNTDSYPLNIGITNGVPTAVLHHSFSGKILVAVAHATQASSRIVKVDFTAGTGAIAVNAGAAYSNPTFLNQPTAMVEDTDTGAVYLAINNGSTGTPLGTIEKFTVDAATGVMTRVGTFVSPSLNTTCVGSMFVGQ